MKYIKQNYASKITLNLLADKYSLNIDGKSFEDLYLYL